MFDKEPLEVMNVMNYTEFMTKKTTSGPRHDDRSGAYASPTAPTSALNVSDNVEEYVVPARTDRKQEVKRSHEANAQDERDHLVHTLAARVADLQARVDQLCSLMPEIPDPLQAARTRGKSYMADELDKPEQLSLDAAQSYAGRSNRAINDERRRRQLYALVQNGKQRGYRYPRWQFDIPADRLRPVLRELAAHEVGDWGMHAFFNQPHPRLGDRTPRAALEDPATPLDDILGAVHTRYADEQGGS